jgi:hypothetical protein
MDSAGSSRLGSDKHENVTITTITNNCDSSNSSSSSSNAFTNVFNHNNTSIEDESPTHKRRRLIMLRVGHLLHHVRVQTHPELTPEPESLYQIQQRKASEESSARDHQFFAEQQQLLFQQEADAAQLLEEEDERLQAEADIEELTEERQQEEYADHEQGEEEISFEEDSAEEDFAAIAALNHRQQLIFAQQLHRSEEQQSRAGSGDISQNLESSHEALFVPTELEETTLEEDSDPEDIVSAGALRRGAGRILG